MVTYEVADLNRRLPTGDRIFDLVFSSNVFEHIEHIEGLIEECSRVVKDDGTVIVAVPPICSPLQLVEDIKNQYHFNHIPPTAWHAKLLRFFSAVDGHSHDGVGEFAPSSKHFSEMLLRQTK
jgi:ubiquinone/menaquinone biosynthesis C-methylase UbiE